MGWLVKKLYSLVIEVYILSTKQPDWRQQMNRLTDTVPYALTVILGCLLFAAYLEGVLQ